MTKKDIILSHPLMAEADLLVLADCSVNYVRTIRCKAAYPAKYDGYNARHMARKRQIEPGYREREREKKRACYAERRRPAA